MEVVETGVSKASEHNHALFSACSCQFQDLDKVRVIPRTGQGPKSFNLVQLSDVQSASIKQLVSKEPSFPP